MVSANSINQRLGAEVLGMTKLQQAVVDEMKATGTPHIDADSNGVAHLNGKTVNGNMIRSLTRQGVLLTGTVPGCNRWRYTLAV